MSMLSIPAASTGEVPAAVEEVLSSIGSSTALVANADDDDKPELDEKLSSKHGDIKSERAIAAAKWVDKEVRRMPSFCPMNPEP